MYDEIIVADAPARYTPSERVTTTAVHFDQRAYFPRAYCFIIARNKIRVNLS